MKPRLAVAAALAASLASSAAAAAPTLAPRTLLRTDRVQAVAFDGRRVLLSGSGGGSLVVRNLDTRSRSVIGASSSGTCRRLGCHGAGGLVLAGLQAAWQESGGGNTEAWGSWSVGGAGSRARTVREWHAFTSEQGASNIGRGHGYAGQGTVLVYALADRLYRVEGRRSRQIASGVLHVWAVNARRIVAELPDRSLELLDPDGHRLTALPQVVLPAAGHVTDVLLQGDRLAVVTDVHDLQVYDATTGEAQLEHRLPSWAYGSLSGDLLVYEPYLGQARVLDVASGHDRPLPGVRPWGGLRLSAKGLDYLQLVPGVPPHGLVQELPFAAVQAAAAA